MAQRATENEGGAMFSWVLNACRLDKPVMKYDFYGYCMGAVYRAAPDSPRVVPLTELDVGAQGRGLLRMLVPLCPLWYDAGFIRPWLSAFPRGSGKRRPQGLFFALFSPMSLAEQLRGVSPVLTAVLVDAAFYIKRSRRIYGAMPPKEAASKLHELALKHLYSKEYGRARLYRIFVYDAPPTAWRGNTQIKKTFVDFSGTPASQWRREFHKALLGMRKVALRLGVTAVASPSWQIKPDALASLISGERQCCDLEDEDFFINVHQKGVDMRIGLDIASLAFKRQVNQIILVSGDSDFVPAAKLARREGIDFLLDPMWASIRPELYEHIDGLKSVCPKPEASS